MPQPWAPCRKLFAHAGLLLRFFLHQMEDTGSILDHLDHLDLETLELLKILGFVLTSWPVNLLLYGFSMGFQFDWHPSLPRDASSPGLLAWCSHHPSHPETWNQVETTLGIRKIKIPRVELFNYRGSLERAQMINLLWISLVEPAFTSQVQFLRWCLCVFAGFQCQSHWEVLMQPASSSPSCRTWTQVDLTDQARPMTPELPALNSLIVLESDASWTACWSTNPGLRHSRDTSGNMWQHVATVQSSVRDGLTRLQLQQALLPWY